MVIVLDKQNHVPLIHGLFFSNHHACNEYKMALIQVIEFSMGLACTWAATLTLTDIIISDMYMYGSFPCLTLVRPTPLVHSESFKLSLSQTRMRSMRFENIWKVCKETFVTLVAWLNEEQSWLHLS